MAKGLAGVVVLVAVMGAVAPRGGLAQPAPAAAEVDRRMQRTAWSAKAFVSFANREYDSHGATKSVLAAVEPGSEYGVYETPGGKFLAVSLRTVADVGARLGAAFAVDSPAQVLANLKSEDPAHHPMVTIELEATLARVARVSALLKPLLTRLPAEQEALAKLDAPLAAIAAEVKKIEETPIKRRVAAYKKVPLEPLKAHLTGVLAALKGEGGPKVFEAYLRLADLEPALATGTPHPASGQVLSFEDDSRTYRRYRFVSNTLVHYHAAVDLLLAGALVWQRAAVVQKKWDANADALEAFVEALAQARYAGDPARSVRIRSDLTGREAFDAKLRVVSIGEWLKSVVIATHFSVRSQGGLDIAGRPVRARALPVNDGTPWETPEEELRRRAEAAKAAANAPLDANASSDEVLRRARDMAVDAARQQHGYDNLVFEASLVADMRYTVVYYGTPDIPSGAKQVLIVAIADPRAATSVAITELGWNTDHWSRRPVAQLQAEAEKFRGRQLFGKVSAKKGVAEVPMRVLVFAR